MLEVLKNRHASEKQWTQGRTIKSCKRRRNNGAHCGSGCCYATSLWRW